MADDNSQTKPGRPGPHTAPQIDYRFTLANEQAYIGWGCAALGLLAAAIMVAFVPQLTIPGPRLFLGGVLGVLATLIAALGLQRWELIDHAIRRGEPMARHSRAGISRVYHHRNWRFHNSIRDRRSARRLTQRE